MTAPDREAMALGKSLRAGAEVDMEAPFLDAQEVTPDDANDLPRNPAFAFRVGGAGDVEVTTVDGSQATIVGLAAGEVFRLAVTRIHATGTSATGIVALYY